MVQCKDWPEQANAVDNVSLIKPLITRMICEDNNGDRRLVAADVRFFI
jgi:hypothetical protein